MDRQLPLGIQGRATATIIIDGSTFRAFQVDADGLLVPRGAIPLRNAPAANTAAVITIAAVAGARHELSYISYRYSALAAAGVLTVENGAGVTVFDAATVLTAALTTNIFFTHPLRGSVNTAMIITLPTGGAAVTGVLCAGYFDVSSL